MPQTRQSDPGLIRTLETIYSAGTRLPFHSHEWHQLIYASSGVMTVNTESCAWVIPPQRAVWMPADVRHQIVTGTKTRMETLYLRPRRRSSAPRQCTAINVPPLLRELIRHIVRIRVLESANPAHVRLAAVLLDQLNESPVLPLELPMPSDPRALRVAGHILDRPGEAASLDQLATKSGAAKRTIQRIFAAETGIPFSRWRQQARLLEALRRLAAGESVTTAALDAGYGNPSSFIAVFKQAFGVTPRRYYQVS